MKKIKKWLAFWLQDELIDMVVKDRWLHSVTEIPMPITQAFETVQCEYVINEKDTMDRFNYEKAIDKMHNEMYNFVKKNIKVDSHPLTSPEYRYSRVIRCTLRLGKI